MTKKGINFGKFLVPSLSFALTQKELAMNVF